MVDQVEAGADKARCVGTFLGIDPGVTGAIAIFRPAVAGDHLVLTIHDMPVTRDGSKDVLDELALLTLLGGITADEVAMSAIEKVGPQANEGAAGAFSFGRMYGALAMALAALRFARMQVPPVVWKRQFSLIKAKGTTVDKGASVAKACELMPDCASLFRGVRGGLKHGRAEAALLGVVAIRSVCGYCPPIRAAA